MTRTITIGVIGAAVCDADEAEVAEETGARIARRGALLVCGGMGGVMEAACRGARSVGGTTVGILPGNDRTGANAYVDIVIPTGIGFARNAMVVLASRGVIAVGGRYGTLSEIAYCRIYRVPVVGIRTWRVCEPRFGEPIPQAERPGEAVEMLFRAISEIEV